MNKHFTTSLPELPELAKKMAKTLKGGEVLALIGNLGSGKTSFAKLLAKQMGVSRPVSSPTFVLMNRYRARLSGKTPVFLLHLDLYRTKNIREVRALGITEWWNDKHAVTVIEWADKIKKYLPKNTTFIYFKSNESHTY